ncbi:hypothetical protein D9K79_00850 [Acinetobacter cumulans]|uniref:Tail fiber protein n=1 Tax=Acinetobacter cumulans TaxID=2136182 RepID=A0ABX9UAR9_9GAMM|nr:hypothetical protein [Acinetobacter cumulans]RLL50331.1 hypothetical protein D9K79_00850 [Acinetobacter cumulans]
MHSPKPYSLAVNGRQPTEKDNDFILSVVRRFSNFKSVQELDSLRQRYNLPDGGFFTVQDMGGIFKVIVDKPEDPVLIYDGLAKLNTTAFYSGVITRAIVLDEDIPSNKPESYVGIKLTDQCLKRLAGYDSSNPLPAKQQYLRRLKIKYHPSFNQFEPEQQGIFIHSQYQKLKASWYSGSMAAIVQIISGYGIQNFEQLPDDPIERAEFKLPEKYLEQAEEELNFTRLPGYSGFPNAEGQIQYEFGAEKTHAVGFDTENKPWLLEISARGVYAMPLPVIPITATQAFKQFAEETGDTELLQILNTFGAMPSGEGFPEDLETWLRTGAVIKICGSADFYNHYAMYAACGWSFNSRGSEAFNTCWSFAENGLMHAYGYKLSLKLQAAPDKGNLGAVSVSSADSRAIPAYISMLNNAMPQGEQKTIAIQYKLRRVDKQLIVDRAAAWTNAENEVNYWDGLELPPIAQHTGSISRVTAGPVYWGNKDHPESMGMLKFPASTAEGCASFSMVSPDYSGGLVKCDTVMFGCYVDDTLRTVKYFIDENKFYKKEESTFEKYMYVGEWENTVTTGQTGLMGYFYTSDFDERDESPDITVYTHIRGTDLGYGNPAYTTPPLLYCVGGLTRSRYYKHVKTTKQSSQVSLSTAICVPVFARDAVLHAFSKNVGSEIERLEQYRGSVLDPNFYQLWCYDNAFHWIGETENGNRGFPRSKEGVPVYVDTYKYEPNEANDFADSGNWFGLTNGNFIDVTGICGPYTSRSSNHVASGVTVGGEAPAVPVIDRTQATKNKATGSVALSAPIAGASKIHSRIPDSWYFGFSPVLAGNSLVYFYRGFCKVSFGETDYVNISEAKENGKNARWGSSRLVDDQNEYTFIGVINE